MQKLVVLREKRAITWTVYQVGLTGLKNRENLGFEELEQWMAEKYGKYATVQVTCDQTGETHIYTDDGFAWDKVG